MLVTQICIPKGGSILERIWKKQHLGSEACAGIGMKIRERKNILIKNNIARNINAPFRWLKTFKTFVGVAVAKKDTSFGTELNLSCIVGAKIGPTCTPKSSKKGVVRCMTMTTFKGGFIMNYLGWKVVNKKDSSEKRFILKI
jgi:hypothetical protein